jgi:nucleoside-diphosphate-sugar epimerase
MPRVLITGASGFIGTPLARALIQRGYEVHGLSRSTPPSEFGGIHRRRIDLLQPGAPARAIAETRPDIVVHLAWETAHGSFWESPHNTQWIAATLELARAFVEMRGSRFVGMGSCAEYSWQQVQPGEALRECSPALPSTCYGRAKKACFERLAQLFESERVPFAWGRLFFPYGPGDRRPALVPTIIRALISGDPANISSGTQVRDFIYIDDVVSALVALAESTASGAFNLSTGHGTPVAAMAETIAAECGQSDLLRPGALPDREGEPAWLVGSPRKIKLEIGWSPRISVDDGIRSTVHWWRQEP